MPSQPLSPSGLREDNSGGVREVLRIAFPLIMVNIGQSAKLFCDRLMLSWFDGHALSASFTGGITHFMFLTFFFGICGYAATFVAQYTGAGRHERVGLVVWQAIGFSLVCGLLLALVGFAARPIFDLMGHDPKVRAGEIEYFRVLMFGAGGPLLTAALASFWVGRGKTWTIVAMQALSILANIFGNWWLIFGTGGCFELSRRAAAWTQAAQTSGPGGALYAALAAVFLWIEGALNASAVFLGIPRMGIAGAALATIGTEFVSVLFLFVLFLLPGTRRHFGTWPRKFVDAALMVRMIRFGLPNGIQFFVDVASFNFFGILMGRYGPDVHFAATVAFSSANICVMPMIGLANASGILVGQSIGAADIPHALRSVASGRNLIILYSFVVGALLLFWPDRLSALFARGGADGQAPALALANEFLLFAVFYLVFDGLFFLFSAAIRGAGDTRFAMRLMAALAVGLLVIPSFAAYRFFGAGPKVLWSVLVAYVVISSLMFYWRYRQGAWQKMKVIEETVIESPREAASAPSLDTAIAARTAESGRYYLP